MDHAASLAWPTMPRDARPLGPAPRDADSLAATRVFSRSEANGALIEVFTISEDETRALYALVRELIGRAGENAHGFCIPEQEGFAPGRHGFRFQDPLAQQRELIVREIEQLVERDDQGDELTSLRRWRAEAQRELIGVNAEAERLVAQLSAARATAAALGEEMAEIDRRIGQLAAEQKTCTDPAG